MMKSFLTIALSAIPLLAADEAAVGMLKKHCFQCHGKAATGGISLEQLVAVPSLGENFAQWEKVAAVLEQKRMPPEKMPQPADSDRQQAVSWIRGELRNYALKNAGDPGRVTVRRLTSGEYAYTIRDLTGVDFKVDQDFANDSVGSTLR